MHKGCARRARPEPGLAPTTVCDLTLGLSFHTCKMSTGAVEAEREHTRSLVQTPGTMAAHKGTTPPQSQLLCSPCKAATDLRLWGVEIEAGRAPGATHPPLRNVVCLQKKLGPVCISSSPTRAQADAWQIRKTEKGPEEFSPKPAWLPSF